MCAIASPNAAEAARHIPDAVFESYLDSSLEASTRRLVRDHLDSCRECWSRWNLFRWRKAEGSRDLRELRGFLGSRMMEGIDSSWRLAEEWQRVDHDSPDDVERFYATTRWYLFNSTIWEASGQRPKYAERALSIIERLEVRTICDFGCGAGTDGLYFAERGLNVVFVDINEHLLEFVQWRLGKRRLRGEVATPASLAACLPVDLIWAMDVIEHLVDPARTLSQALAGAGSFIFDSDHVGTSSGRQPFHFQHDPDAFAHDVRGAGFEELEGIKDFNVWVKPR
jgi:SAM-dependent methyltransferase